MAKTMIFKKNEELKKRREREKKGNFKFSLLTLLKFLYDKENKHLWISQSSLS